LHRAILSILKQRPYIEALVISKLKGLGYGFQSTGLEKREAPELNEAEHKKNRREERDGCVFLESILGLAQRDHSMTSARPESID